MGPELFRSRAGCTAGLLAAIFSSAAIAAAEDPAYTQVRAIEVKGVDGEKAQLHSFCIDSAGYVLAGVGGAHQVQEISASGLVVRDVNAPPQVLRYDPTDGRLLESWEVPIKPEALCRTPEGLILVAGEGKIAVLAKDGSQVRQAIAPHAKILLENEAELRAAAEAELNQNKEMFGEQLEQLRASLEKFAGRSEEELTEAERMEKQSYEQSLEIFEGFQAQFDIPIEQHMASMRASKMKFSSISATPDFVFAAVPALTGYGFEVWRMTRDFGDPQQIVKNLSGCCGQMEVRAEGEEVFVAENARHRVCCYDTGGNLKYQFGERATRTGSGPGFGSCCNPMNLAFTEAGDLFAAEAEGVVKLFSRDGSYQGLAAKARLPGGCKNVAVRTSPDGRRLFLVDIVGARILVFQKESIARPKPLRPVYDA